MDIENSTNGSTLHISASRYESAVRTTAKVLSVVATRRGGLRLSDDSTLTPEDLGWGLAPMNTAMNAERCDLPGQPDAHGRALCGGGAAGSDPSNGVRTCRRYPAWVNLN